MNQTKKSNVNSNKHKNGVRSPSYDTENKKNKKILITMADPLIDELKQINIENPLKHNYDSSKSIKSKNEVVSSNQGEQETFDSLKSIVDSSIGNTSQIQSTHFNKKSYSQIKDDYRSRHNHTGYSFGTTQYNHSPEIYSTCPEISYYPNNTVPKDTITKIAHKSQSFSSGNRHSSSEYLQGFSNLKIGLNSQKSFTKKINMLDPETGKDIILGNKEEKVETLVIVPTKSLTKKKSIVIEDDVMESRSINQRSHINSETNNEKRKLIVEDSKDEVIDNSTKDELTSIICKKKNVEVNENSKEQNEIKSKSSNIEEDFKFKKIDEYYLMDNFEKNLMDKNENEFYISKYWNPKNYHGEKIYSFELFSAIIRMVKSYPEDLKFSIKDNGGANQGNNRSNKNNQFNQRTNVSKPSQGANRNRSYERTNLFVMKRKIKIPHVPSENCWQPNCFIQIVPLDQLSDEAKLQRENENILKNLTILLNKLSKENFNKIASEIQEIKPQLTTNSRINAFVDLIFDKATTERPYCGMYAVLCYSFVKDKQKNPNSSMVSSFKACLINKISEEFNKTHNDLFDVRKGAAEDEDEKIVRAKLAILGNIQFIGELFKCTLVNDETMRKFLDHLTTFDEENPSTEQIERLHTLFITAGEKISKTITNIFKHINRIKKLAANKKIGSRHRCMLLDIIDLRLEKDIMETNNPIKNNKKSFQPTTIPKKITSILKNHNKEPSTTSEQSDSSWIVSSKKTNSNDLFRHNTKLGKNSETTTSSIIPVDLNKYGSLFPDDFDETTQQEMTENNSHSKLNEDILDSEDSDDNFNESFKKTINVTYDNYKRSQNFQEVFDFLEEKNLTSWSQDIVKLYLVKGLSDVKHLSKVIDLTIKLFESNVIILQTLIDGFNSYLRHVIKNDMFVDYPTLKTSTVTYLQSVSSNIDSVQLSLFLDPKRKRQTKLFNEILNCIKKDNALIHKD